MRSGFGCPSGDGGDVRGSFDGGQGVRGASGKRGAGVARDVGGGSRAIGTRARRRGFAGRARRSSGVASCTTSRRRGRRSGPLTRLPESTLSGRGRRSSGSIRGRAVGVPPRLRGVHPTAEPCLPARAGVRGLAPGCGTLARRRRAPAHPAAGAMPSAMRRNSARRSACTRRAASRSVSAAAAASSSSKSTPGLRRCSAPGSERNLA